MITININPIAFSIGALHVRWYGLMYVVAITVGLLVIWPYAKWKGFSDEQMETIVVWAVPAGLIGARLYYVVQQPLGPYLADPLRIFAVWEGGMAFYGAIFAVVLVLAITGWRNSKSTGYRRNFRHRGSVLRTRWQYHQWRCSGLSYQTSLGIHLC